MSFCMKKYSLAALACILSLGLIAQTKPAPAQSKSPPPGTGDCGVQWYSLFKERGAAPIADGTHDVIISLRTADYSECFMGKVDVTDGKLSSRLQIQKVDGSYEEFDRKVTAAYQNAEGVLKDDYRTIENGMTWTFPLSNGENIRLFFYKSLNGKPKANKKAPSPASLIN
jgi:hypothetical protein